MSQGHVATLIRAAGRYGKQVVDRWAGWIKSTQDLVNPGAAKMTAPVVPVADLLKRVRLVNPSTAPLAILPTIRVDRSLTTTLVAPSRTATWSR